MDARSRQKYLLKNPVTAAIEPVPPPVRAWGVVIPVYAENAEIALTLRSLEAARRAAQLELTVLLVVNRPEGAPESAAAENEALLEDLRREGGRRYGGGLSLGQNLFFIAVADALTDGVGAARKLGMDALLPLLTADGVIASCDADAPVSENYFVELRAGFAAHPEWAGAVIGFEHRLPEAEAERRAIRRYEAWLRDYAAQCRQAGSPYGFCTLGSAFAARVAGYVRAGGMRRRAGGEDFYFLQALAKTGAIGEIGTARVYPSGRASFRVPFGTGPAVRKLAAGGELEFYDPAIFAALKVTFTALAAADCDGLRRGSFLSGGGAVAEFLEAGSFREDWQNIVANTPPGDATALRAAFHRWFDGLCILKFCHWFQRKNL